MSCRAAITREGPRSDKEMGMYLRGLFTSIDHRYHPDLSELYNQIPRDEWPACFGAYMRGFKGTL